MDMDMDVDMEMDMNLMSSTQCDRRVCMPHEIGLGPSPLLTRRTPIRSYHRHATHTPPNHCDASPMPSLPSPAPLPMPSIPPTLRAELLRSLDAPRLDEVLSLAREATRASPAPPPLFAGAF